MPWSKNARAVKDAPMELGIRFLAGGVPLVAEYLAELLNRNLNDEPGPEPAECPEIRGRQVQEVRRDR